MLFWIHSESFYTCKVVVVEAEVKPPEKKASRRRKSCEGNVTCWRSLCGRTKERQRSDREYDRTASDTAFFGRAATGQQALRLGMGRMVRVFPIYDP